MAGRTGVPGLVGYLKQFATAEKTVDVLHGPPEIHGRFFYSPDMRGFNFGRSRQRIGVVLDGLVSLIGEPEPPAVAVQSTALRDFLPGFERDNRIDFVPEHVIPRAWIGNKVRVVPHFDLFENLAIVVAGSRRFLLFPPDQIENLYVGPFDFSPAGAPVSLVDPAAPDLVRYPRYAAALAEAQSAELGAGDAIYLPYMWWHGVDSLESMNLLINYWWNDEQPPGSPFDALLHASIVFGAMTPEHQAVWRGLLEALAFKRPGEALSHLAPEHRGALGGLSGSKATAMLRMLGSKLSSGK